MTTFLKFGLINHVMNKTTETDVQAATSSTVNQTSGAPTGMRSPSGTDWRSKERKGGLAARFWTKVDLNGPVPAHKPELGPCWVWKAAITDLGYGSLWVDGRTELAHVVGFQIAGHNIPSGLELDHLCRNRACVRFDHVEPVTHLVNMRRSPLVTKNGRFHYLEQHPRARLSEEELRRRATERTRRLRSTPEGRAAYNARMREYTARKKAESRALAGAAINDGPADRSLALPVKSTREGGDVYRG